MNFRDKVEYVSNNDVEMITSIKEALDYLGKKQRGRLIVNKINNLLNKYNVFIDGDINHSWIYKELKIYRNDNAKTRKIHDYNPEIVIGTFSQANQGDKIVSVSKESSIDEAIYLMMKYDYSQIPVMRNGQAIGMVTWKSIGQKIAQRKKSEFVSHVMIEPKIIKYDTPILKVIDILYDAQAVLVQNERKQITGIFTSSDIGIEFKKRYEPFILIEKIENYIRLLLHDKIPLSAIKKVAVLKL